MKNFNHKTSEEKDHAEFSASGAARWLNCPGSIALSKKAPPQRDSPYAAEGTEAHACLEFLLKNHVKLGAALKLAAKKYSADMVEHAEFAVNWILERAGASDTRPVILCETKVDSSPFTCTGQFGTLDAAIVEEFGTLVVIDYKYGAGIAVDPEGDDGQGNPQLVYYALAISHMYHHNFEKVELVVIQPRAFHRSGDVVRTFAMSIDDLRAWGKKFRDGVMETSDSDAKLRAGSWCKFCPAGVICPEIKNAALRSAQVDFSDETGLVSTPDTLALINTDLPNIGKILEGCEKLETWIEKVRDHARQILEAGGEVPGWKLVEKRAVRKWGDPETAAAVAKRQFGDFVFTDPELLSPAQFERTMKGKDGAAFLQRFCTAESSGVTLAKASDKRPAVKSLAAKDFA